MVFSPLRLTAFAIVAGLSCSSGSCSSSTDAAPPASAPAPIARFVVPTDLAALDGERWLDHPWPSDFRRDASGRVRIEGFPNPRASKVIATWVRQVGSDIADFSPVAAGFLSFEGAIDQAKLPDAKGSLEASATLQLVDVDETSPDVGKRVPLQWRFRAPVGDFFVAPNTLAFAPVLGASMRPKGRYAIVVTRELTGPGGAAGPSPALSAVLAGEGPLGGRWSGALGVLDKAGLPRARIAHLSVFTVGDPIADSVRLAAHARAQPVAKVKSLSVETKDAADYDQYTGVYEGAPDYQAGTPPYAQEGGKIAFDAQGAPIVQRTFELRFKLLVPKADKCPPPAAGYPLVLYAHGTGGKWTSFVTDGTGPALAAKCLASMGVDQIFHGARPGAPAEDDPDAESKIELTFFNVANADAARNSNKQAAVDEIVRARLVATGGLTIPSTTSATGAAITFDPKRLGFYGHSQGTFNGALFLALDDTVRGAVLSGACGSLAHWTMLRTNATPSVPQLLRILLGVGPEFEDELGPLHPALALLQTLVDPIDPIHYYPLITRAPLAGHAPKSVLMTEGIAADGSGDTFVPPPITEGFALSAGYPLLAPVVRDIPLLTAVAGIPVATLPLKGNLAGGRATGGIAQFVPSGGVDGHYVARQGKAREMTMTFAASLLSDDVPTLPAP